MIGKFFTVITIFSLTFGFFPAASRAESQPGVLIVKLTQSQDLSAYGTVERLYDSTYRIAVADKQAVLAELRAASAVEFAEEDARVKTETTVSDPWFVLDTQELTRQWYLPKMEVHKAWDVTRGAAIPVAIIDTGISGRHEDLNDGRVIRGYVNYCQAMSASVPNQCLVRITGELAPGSNSDDNGHGTIVAGIIGAIQNNSKGIAGINWNVRLMPIKALDSGGSGLASDVAVAIRWAADNGARIINLSIGGPGFQGAEVLQDAVSYAFNKGILIVAAAGNDAAITGGNLNTDQVLPVCADGGANMIIGVAAVDINDRKAKFSNYGSNCIDISASGTGTFVDRTNKQGLLSTYYDPTRPSENNLYVYALGTSVAAPMVAGTAGLVMSAFPDLDVRAVRDRIISSTDNIDAINQTGCNGGTCAGQIGKGRLNALKAVTSTASFQAGTLIKSPEGLTFLVERGLKRPISGFVLNQRFSGHVVVAATNEQLNSFPTGPSVPSVDGTLIKEPAVPTVYVVEGGEMRALSMLAFISRGFKFEQINTLSAAEIAGYTRGTDAPVIDGVLVKAPDHPAVFILNKGVRQLLSFFVFQQRGFNNQTIASLSLEELAAYPTHPSGFLYSPLEGTLIRGDISPTVYLIEAGKRRGLNLGAFQNRGFSFANVKVVPQSELEGYEAGDAIIE